MSAKKQKAVERNWSIYQLAGIVSRLDGLAAGRGNLTASEMDEAAQLSNDVARFLARVRETNKPRKAISYTGGTVHIKTEKPH